MLDPQAKALLDAIAAAGRPPLHTLSAEQARAEYKNGRTALQTAAPEVAAADDREVPGPRGPIPVRLYRARGTSETETLPALVFFHGGGFTVGDLDTHDGICRTLANAAHCAVMSVDYRMGPEHKFPAAVEDCFAATRWVADEAEALHIDADRIAVGGDSAGGNLAAVVALLARDAGGPALAFQLMIYPTTTLHHNTKSAGELARGGYLLTLETMHFFRESYLRGPQDRDDWRASPLLAPDCSRLPPAYILTAGYDPLRDEGKAYADRLQAAGVPVQYRCYEGMIHGFVTMTKALDAANRALEDCGAALRAALHK